MNKPVTSFYSNIPANNRHSPLSAHAASVVSALLAIPDEPLQGHGHRKPASGYNKYAVSDYRATDFYGDNENFDEFQGNNYSIYAEHGVRDDVAFFGTLLFQDIEQTRCSRRDAHPTAA